MTLALPWGVANHIDVNILVSLLSSGEPGRRSAVMGLYSAVTYLAHFLAGAGLGLVCAGEGLTAVAAVAAVGLVAAAGMVVHMLRR